MDEDGMRVDALERLLEEHRDRRPKCVYVIPTGQNPTGITMSTERKRALYEVIYRHRMLLLEDDPYFNLYYGSAPAQANTPTGKQRALSFFEMDRHHIVLRFDSLSKILSSGRLASLV
jgi:DNA-binding transcriptional MocR family regulator